MEDDNGRERKRFEVQSSVVLIISLIETLE
jgi:hypothetical protein